MLFFVKFVGNKYLLIRKEDIVGYCNADYIFCITYEKKSLFHYINFLSS